jgi:carbonic anhydrase
MVVLRNMGGRVEAIMPDILTLDAVIKFKNIYVIHHTGEPTKEYLACHAVIPKLITDSQPVDCGATWLSEDTVRQELSKVPGADPKAIDALPLPIFTE